jgi:hypothetical protein
VQSTRNMKMLTMTFGLLLMAASLASAQNAEPPYRGQGYTYFSLGSGTDYAAVVEQVGFGGEGFLCGGLGLGADAGFVHSGRGFARAWIGSVDASYHFRRRAARGQVDPFVFSGFSIFGPTSRGGGRGSPAANVGGGVNVWLWKHAALRFEGRDYVSSGDYIPGYQYLSLGVGVTFR